MIRDCPAVAQPGSLISNAFDNFLVICSLTCRLPINHNAHGSRFLLQNSQNIKLNLPHQTTHAVAQLSQSHMHISDEGHKTFHVCGSNRSCVVRLQRDKDVQGCLIMRVIGGEEVVACDCCQNLLREDRM
jgi:hypothetical protein